MITKMSTSSIHPVWDTETFANTLQDIQATICSNSATRNPSPATIKKASLLVESAITILDEAVARQFCIMMKLSKQKPLDQQEKFKEIIPLVVSGLSVLEDLHTLQNVHLKQLALFSQPT
jgi:hypothetical protein